MATRLMAAARWRHCAVASMFIVFMVAVNLRAASSVSAEQVTGWSQPVALSSHSQSSWFPDIATDASGSVHVVWSTGLSAGIGRAFDVVMYTASQDGVNWKSAADIFAFPSKGAVTRASLLADSQGVLHMTFRLYTIYYSHGLAQAVNAASMLPPQAISAGEDGYFSRVVVDSLGRLHVILTENAQDPSCPDCFHVFHRQSDDNGLSWSPLVDISRVATGAAKPQVVVDAQGNLFVAWEAGSGGDLGQLDQSVPTAVMYTASYDRGQSWIAPITLAAFPKVDPTVSPPTTTPAATLSKGALTATPPSPTPTAIPVIRSFKNIALGLDGKGQLVVAWLAVPDDRVYYQVSGDQGHSWSDPQIIPGVWGAYTIYRGVTDDYSMATDSAGVIHLALVGRTKENDTALSVLHLSWNSYAWSAPEAIVSMTGDVPEWPRLAVGLGNQLHAVWFVRDQAHIFQSGGATQYRIWYSHTQLAAPALTPVVWPTPSPTLNLGPALATPAMAAPVASLTPTVAPSPTPGAPTSSNLVYNELDYLKVVAKGLVPAVVIIFIVVGAVLLIRR